MANPTLDTFLEVIILGMSMSTRWFCNCRTTFNMVRNIDMTLSMSNSSC